MDIIKSWVRIIITVFAGIYLFFGSGYLIWYFVKYTGEKAPIGADTALTLFNTVLPIATGIVTYWFAARSNKTSSPPSTK